MMATQTLPITRTMVRERTAEQFTTPANSMVAVVNGVAALGPLRQALAVAGIDGHQIEVIAGTNGLQRIDNAYAGIVGTARRLVHRLGLGPEAALTRQYERELADGNLLITIRNINRTLAEEVRNILVDHNGRYMQHYGRFTVAILAP